MSFLLSRQYRTMERRGISDNRFRVVACLWRRLGRIHHQRRHPASEKGLNPRISCPSENVAGNNIIPSRILWQYPARVCAEAHAEECSPGRKDARKDAPLRMPKSSSSGLLECGVIVLPGRLAATPTTIHSKREHGPSEDAAARDRQPAQSPISFNPVFQKERPHP
jgi:hypothetical protein